MRTSDSGSFGSAEACGTAFSMAGRSWSVTGSALAASALALRRR